MTHFSTKRRTLLKAFSLAAAGMALPKQLLAAAQEALHWQNWSGNQQCQPQAIHYPSSEEQLIGILNGSSGTVRCIGGSHSFSPLIPTNDTLISLEALSGMRSHDSAALTSTFGAGTRIGLASAMNYQIGQSLQNEPDINLQSLAGALATATHGTGTTLPSLSGMIKSLRLATANGEILDIDASQGDLFRAACCHIGALGVVTEITLQNVPTYHLEEKTQVMDLRDAMDLIENEKDQQRNIEFFAFAHGEKAIVKTTNTTELPDTETKQDDSNELLEMACDVSMKAPWTTSMIQKAVSFFVEEETRRGPAHKIYANTRSVAFNEMEYTVPAEDGLACLEKVVDTIQKQDINVFFPIEYRYSAADNSLLSMFSERAGASISVHQYHKQDYAPLFNAVEPIFHQHQGRPHWGKLHTMKAEQLASVYPHFETFQNIRQQLDPEQRFVNQHIRDVLGISGA